jgi:hypothetical protein
MGDFKRNDQQGDRKGEYRVTKAFEAGDLASTKTKVFFSGQ